MMARQRKCNVCPEWHDLSEPWPEACAGHFERAKLATADPEKRSIIYDDKMVERGHWKQDRETGEMIPIAEWEAKYKSSTGLVVIKDIEPYKNVYGEVIGGRRQHRDFLKARGVTEVGNEVITKKYEAPPDLEGDIRRALEETGYRG